LVLPMAPRVAREESLSNEALNRDLS
jgi:hypothetical protein